MSESTQTPPLPADPLRDLIVRVTADVKVAYDKSVITALVELERREPGPFVVIYNALKKCPNFIAGCSIN